MKKNTARKIKKGMSYEEVVKILGRPIIIKDPDNLDLSKPLGGKVGELIKLFSSTYCLWETDDEEYHFVFEDNVLTEMTTIKRY